MDPHPLFADRAIPERRRLGPFLLRGLGPEDLDEDLAALRETEAGLAGLFGDPADPWPARIARDENLVDLCWHRREFQARRSFAWVIADPGTDAYLGCAYLYQGFFPDAPMKAVWWFRASADRRRAAVFGPLYLGWLAGAAWPDLPVVARGRRGRTCRWSRGGCRRPEGARSGQTHIFGHEWPSGWNVGRVRTRRGAAAGSHPP